MYQRLGFRQIGSLEMEIPYCADNIPLDLSDSSSSGTGEGGGGVTIHTDPPLAESVSKRSVATYKEVCMVWHP